MAQGTGKHKQRERQQALSIRGKKQKYRKKTVVGSKRKNAPAKQVAKLRDKRITKMLHKNIENLMAAKALKNDGHLRLGEINARAKEQLKVMQKTKRKKSRSKEDAMKRQLQNASDRLAGVKKKRSK